jgi:phenylalanyl-tRNA synthetase alpha chain
MLSKLTELEKEITAFVINSAETLEEYRLKYLSRKGLLAQLFDELKTADKEQKPVLGKKLNEVKKLAEGKYDEGKAVLESSVKKSEDIDLSMPGRISSVGREHLNNPYIKRFLQYIQRNRI